MVTLTTVLYSTTGDKKILWGVKGWKDLLIFCFRLSTFSHKEHCINAAPCVHNANLSSTAKLQRKVKTTICLQNILLICPKVMAFFLYPCPVSWTIFCSSKHQQREVPAWWEGEMSWSRNQLNSAAAGQKTSHTNAQFEAGRSQRMRVMGFTERIQEKIPPHHLTTEWVFYLYERDTDVNLPTEIGFFFKKHLKFQLQGNGTCVHSLYSSNQMLQINTYTLLREKRAIFLNTNRNVSQIWNIACTSLGKAT